MTAKELYDLSHPTDITGEGALLLQALCFGQGTKQAVEIGVGNGVSTHALLSALVLTDGRLSSCDTDSVGYVIQFPELKARWSFTQCRSEDFLLPEEFSFAFIDGDHSYETCLLDLKKVGAAIKPGGTIVVHDVATPWKGEHHPGVKQAVSEFLAEYGRWRYLEIGFGPGFGVLKAP